VTGTRRLSQAISEGDGTVVSLERSGVDAVLVGTKKIADLVGGGAPPEV
jgi:hypothetical protein